MMVMMVMMTMIMRTTCFPAFILPSSWHPDHSGQRLSMPALSLYESRSSVSTTAVVATQDPWRRLPTKARAACRRPRSFLRKSNGCGLSRGPDYFVALLFEHVSEPQYLPPSEHRLMAAPLYTYAKSNSDFNGDVTEHSSRDSASGCFDARLLHVVLDCLANGVLNVYMREHWHV